MKHIKKHPINDKAQNLSKDMKKQDHVKPKAAKKIDADDSLSDPKVSKKYSKPSNRKLDGENFLSKDGGKLKKFNEMLDPMGKWEGEESQEENPIQAQSEEESEMGDAKFIAELHQKGEGCDYTIGCGIDVIEIDASNMDEAISKLQSIIDEEYTDDISLKEAIIYEVVNKTKVI